MLEGVDMSCVSRSKSWWLLLTLVAATGLILCIGACGTENSPTDPVADLGTEMDKAGPPDNPGPPDDGVVYEQDFERLRELDANALSNDGWQVFGNAFDEYGVVTFYYGPFPAPNHEYAFCNLVVEGSRRDREKWLNVFGDYNNPFVDGLGNRVDHVEALVFQEFVISADQIGAEATFVFDAEHGNIEGMSTATAFIKTLDPDWGYAQTNLVFEDMTDVGTTWGTYTITLSLADPELEGQILQFGFSATIYNPDYNGGSFWGSGVYYDNLTFSVD
jgi:hypothetical protein